MTKREEEIEKTRKVVIEGLKESLQSTIYSQREALQIIEKLSTDIGPEDKKKNISICSEIAKLLHHLETDDRDTKKLVDTFVRIEKQEEINLFDALLKSSEFPKRIWDKDRK